MPRMPDFAVIWPRLLAHADRPFLTDGGHEFSYLVESDALRLSHRNALITRAVLAEAWAAMPCPVAKLPETCKPKGYVWTLLHDTRIAGTALMPDVPEALAKAAKTHEKSAAALRPKPRKRRTRKRASSRR